MGVFKNKFDGITGKAIRRYAKQFGVRAEQVQLSMYLKQDHEGDWIDHYRILENYKEKKEFEKVPFGDILNLKLDLMNLGQMVPMFVCKTLNRFADVYKTEKKNINAVVLIRKNEDGEDEIIIWLYDGQKPIQALSEQDIFSMEELDEEEETALGIVDKNETE